MGRKVLAGRAFAASLVTAALAIGGFAGLAPSASAAPGDLVATLSGNTGSDPTQNGASATVSCDPATSTFSASVSGIVTGGAGWPPAPPPDDHPYLKLPSGRFDLGAVSGGNASASGIVGAAGDCAVGVVIHVIGPGNDGPSLDISGTLAAQAPPPPSGDTTPPVVHVPANRTVEATGPNGATVTYTGVSANDETDGPLPATCTRSSGSVFPLGTTTVTCRATDAAGNVGSASFTIRVVDTIAPTLTVPANVVERPTSLGRGNTSEAQVGYSATATDVVSGNITPRCVPPPGLFPFATTTVTCVATDRAGNSTTRTFTVTVRAPGSVDDALHFPTATLGAVSGTVSLATSRTPPPVPLGAETKVYACDSLVTNPAHVSTQPAGGKPPLCKEGGTTDGSHTYTVGALTPGSYNLFAVASSDAGDFTAGPVAVTITAGNIITKDITVTYPAHEGGVSGRVIITNVPLGAKFAFSKVYGCMGSVTFGANGAPPAAHGSAAPCTEGHVTPTPNAAVQGARDPNTADSATYEMGPLPIGARKLYFVYATVFGNIVSPGLSVSITNAVTAEPPFTFAFPSQPDSSVQGHVVLATSRTAPPVPLGGEVKVYACRSAITTLAQATSGTTAHGSAPAACREGGTTDGTHYYAVGQLTPGAINLFATASSDAGDFTAGPIAATVAAGQLLTKDITVAFAHGTGGITGTVTATNVPTGLQFAYTHVYACDGTIQFTASGTPQTGGAGPRATNACVEGHLGAATTTSAPRSESDTASYVVGPRAPGPRDVYVVYSSAFGTAVSAAAHVSVPNGGVVSAPTITIRWPTQTDGYVRGHITITGAPTGPPGTEGATPTGEVTGYACKTTVTAYQDIAVTGHGGAAAPCVAGGTTDGSGNYAVGNLTPGNYNLFAKASTLLGDFVGGPFAFTITTGQGVTKDVNVAYPHSSGALFGQAQVTNVPVGVHLEFLHVYVCNGTVQFARDGTVPTATRSQGPQCIEGTLNPATVTSTRTTSTYSATYQVGPLHPNTQQLYVVYQTEFGIVVSSGQSVHPTAGHVGG